MSKNSVNNGIHYLSTGAGFLPSTVLCWIPMTKCQGNFLPKVTPTSSLVPRHPGARISTSCGRRSEWFLGWFLWHPNGWDGSWLTSNDMGNQEVESGKWRVRIHIGSIWKKSFNVIHIWYIYIWYIYIYYIYIIYCIYLYIYVIHSNLHTDTLFYNISSRLEALFPGGRVGSGAMSLGG